MGRLGRAITVALMLLGGAGTAGAACTGNDLMAALPAAARAEIAAATRDVPFAQGTLWQAERAGARITLIGTYHFDDPRHAAALDRVAPAMAEAAALLVEATPEDQAQLKARLAADPGLTVAPSGPTLPERLSPEDWARLSAAMAERGLPAVMASRLRPWYVSLMLGLSPCMLREARTAGAAEGLDQQLVAQAVAAGVPVQGLEPYDTVFQIFAGLSPTDEIEMIRAALPAAEAADDYATTTAEAFFRGEVWALWEFMRRDAYESSGLPKAEVDHQLALMQERLMDRRNAAWIAPIETAATAAPPGKGIVVAVGALHLPGEGGVLRRLERDGWQITPLPAR